MQKNLYQVQQSAGKYRFSFRRLSDQNIKIGCHAIFYLQRLNVLPKGYIIFDRADSFHENLRKLSVYEKSPRKLDKKPAFYAVKAWKPLSIIHFRKNMISFYHQKE